MESPFIYGKTVSSTAFTNREEELARLFSNLNSGINTILIAPRRWGKSSLVEKTLLLIERKEKHIKTVRLDLFTVSTSEEFLELFARNVIKSSSSKWEEWMNTARTFFKQLVPKLSIGLEPTTDFSLSFDWEELRKHADEVLDLPQRIAAKKKVRFVIAIDEFQQIADFANYQALERLLRAQWQKQNEVTYCLYGSKRHMMTQLFDAPSRPFYRFGDMMLLPKIAMKKWESFIVRSFRKTGKKIKPMHARTIAKRMRNHSWYVQQLAHYVWVRTTEEATEYEIEKANEELMRSNAPLYQMEIDRLSRTQINLLKAILAGEKKLTSEKVMKKYHLGTPRNVSKNRETLIRKDIIQKENYEYAFLDPAFESWFNQTFE